MKIGIVTFHSAHNYGAVLQAWSLQQYLKEQGHNVEIVNLRLPVIDKLYQITKKTNREVCKSDFVNRLVNDMYYVVRHAAHVVMLDSAKVKKYNRFEHFIKHKLPVTKEFNSFKDLVQANLQYDALIAGSDQIWNATMMKGISPAYFLQFANKDALRISYAASIGTDEIPPQFTLLFERYLREFDYISVREKKAQAEVEKLTDKTVELVADPTFLLKKESFDKLRKPSKIKGKYIYVHNVHLARVDEDLNSVAEEMSRRLGLPIVHNWNRKVYSKEAGHFSEGIEEFLGVVSDAEYVITNSFHCTVFAIIYHKNFITVPHFKNPDRMRYLLGELGIGNHLIRKGENIPQDLSALAIDYSQVEEKKEIMGEHARNFLKNALAGQKVEDNRNYFERKDVFRCCGCGACKDVCPVNAITMIADKEGFPYPVIDENICIHCGKCKKACVYHKESVKNIPEDKLPLVYAAYAKDEQIVKESTSGGMFTSFYRNILQKGGKVVGVRYNDDMKVVYDIAETEEGCQAFRGSKYVWADSEDVKPRVEKLLKEDNYVLFSGTPCQIAGLKSYLGKDYPKLYTIELICHGTGSPKVFKKYCEYLESAYESKITKFEFRNKFKGVENAFILVEFASGSSELEIAKRNNFNKAYANNNIGRPSCYVCEYAGLKRGVADITIGDYWGIDKEHPEFANEKGVSLLKVNTEKGEMLFNEVKEELKWLESTYEKAYNANHKKPIWMMGTRSRLMHYIDEKPIDDLLLTFNKTKKGGIKGI